MSNLRWSQQECEAVLLEAVELFREKRGRTKLDALREAQSILPPERHKRRYLPPLKRILLDRLERALAVPPPTPPPEPPEPPPTLQELPLGLLVEELVSRVTTSAVAAVKAELAAVTAQQEARLAEPEPEPELRKAPEEVKPKIPRVLIAGLLPAQCEEIRREFERQIAPRFVPKNATARQWRQRTTTPSG